MPVTSAAGRNAMLRMKELWSYLIHLFRDPESYAKKLRKAADPAEFEALTAGMFRELELLPGLEPGFLFWTRPRSGDAQIEWPRST